MTYAFRQIKCTKMRNVFILATLFIATAASANNEVNLLPGISIYIEANKNVLVTCEDTELATPKCRVAREMSIPNNEYSFKFFVYEGDSNVLLGRTGSDKSEELVKLIEDLRKVGACR